MRSRPAWATVRDLEERKDGGRVGRNGGREEAGKIHRKLIIMELIIH
jgi:hypothetical protein